MMQYSGTTFTIIRMNPEDFSYIQIKVGVSQIPQEYSLKKTYLHTNSLFDPRIRTGTNP